MRCLLYIVQVLSLLCTLTRSQYIQQLYTITERNNNNNNNNILKELALADHPGRPHCAVICLQTTKCESFVYDDSTGMCQLQKSGGKTRSDKIR